MQKTGFEVGNVDGSAIGFIVFLEFVDKRIKLFGVLKLLSDCRQDILIPSDVVGQRFLMN